MDIKFVIDDEEWEADDLKKVEIIEIFEKMLFRLRPTQIANSIKRVMIEREMLEVRNKL